MSDELACLKMTNPPGVGPIIRVDQGAGAGASRDLIDFEKASTETFSVDSSGLPDPGGGDAKRTVVVCLGDLAADSDVLENFVVKFEKAVTLTNAYIAVDLDTADGSTNKATITLKRDLDDSDIVAYTTPAANPGLAAATVTTMGALSNTSIAALGYIYCTHTKTSSGLALQGTKLYIDYTLAG